MATLRIYSPFFPYPPDGGSPQVIFNQLVDLIALGHTVELVCWKNSRKEISLLQGRPYLTPFPKEVSIRVLGSRGGWEERPAFKPWFRLKRVTASFMQEEASSELYYYPRIRLPHLPSADLGIYHYSFAYPWLRLPPQENKRVVFFHNLESDLFDQRATDSSGLRARFFKSTAERLRNHENEMSNLVDESWFVSPLDQAKLNGPQSRWVGPTFPSSFLESRNSRFKDPKMLKLGFIGNMEFLPNRASALWIIRELAPLLAKGGFTGKILIAGKGDSSSLREEAARFSFIEFQGFLPEIELFWSELSYLLAPHLFGSGVRMKLLEALASGIPLLCHPNTLQGMHEGLRKNPLIHSFETASDWAGFLLGCKPGIERKKGSAALPAELSGQNVYAFLNQLLK